MKEGFQARLVEPISPTSLQADFLVLDCRLPTVQGAGQGGNRKGIHGNLEAAISDYPIKVGGNRRHCLEAIQLSQVVVAAAGQGGDGQSCRSRVTLLKL